MRVLLHAPNVHVGGGLSLLQALLRSEPCPFAWAQLDWRARKRIALPSGTRVRYVKPSIGARLQAEWCLYRDSREDDVVLCFHGLPPLLPVRGRIVVFMQNRLLLESVCLRRYPLFTRMRIALERIWLRGFSSRCDRFIVQTPSMAQLLQRWSSGQSSIALAPFMPASGSSGVSSEPTARRFDFVYVASGEPHKNHAELLAAWRLLAQQGLKPSLALTVDGRRYPLLAERIATLVAEHGLDVVNLGEVADPALLYRDARAAIYPSSVESLGMPLLEALEHGLPVLAAERDYVRDLLDPVEAFDPDSPLSIARAVARFCGRREAPLAVGTASDFLREVLCEAAPARDTGSV